MQVPIGSMLAEVDSTKTLDLTPGSLAMSLIRTIPSLISGISRSMSFSTNFLEVLLTSKEGGLEFSETFSK